jgi:hypothetical protein
MNHQTSKSSRAFINLVVSVSLLFFLLSVHQVYASEGALGAYPDDIDDFMLGALPPPGACLSSMLSCACAAAYGFSQYSSIACVHCPALAIRCQPFSSPSVS